LSQFHVNQIETHLRSINGSDDWSGDLDDSANLSRLLADYGTKLTFAAADDGSRIIEITDGGDDRGIDAVGVDLNSKLVVLVQSKWRKDGTGSVSLGDVLKFLDGVRAILGMKSTGEPANASEETRRAIRDLLKTPGARIRLVTASTAIDPLAEAVEAPILDLLAQLNDLEDVEPLATHTHLAQADLFKSIVDSARPTIDIELQMSEWGKASEPMKIYYGRVSAAQIAHWYHTHGTELFAENIRVVIPRSDINEGILDTIRHEPSRFLYYNNGITILANSIEMGPGGALTREVGYFRLASASVVNGAQTVSTLGSAIGTAIESNLGEAFVLVRCIEVRTEDVDLGRRITRFANTQNEVSSQDFAFLDQQQHRLVQELKSLGFEYLLRASEVPKSKNREDVIDLRQAAVALACASPNIAHAILAKREVSRLFSDTSVYQTLFNPGTDPLLLQRAVKITSLVDRVLDEVERDREGIEAGIAVHGRRVIAHLVIRRITQQSLENHSLDLGAALKDAQNEIDGYVKAMAEVFPTNAYPGNVFKNQGRVSTLLQEARLM
jgi:AIPR protein